MLTKKGLTKKGLGGLGPSQPHNCLIKVTKKPMKVVLSHNMLHLPKEKEKEKEKALMMPSPDTSPDP